jgi:hypothetical protein
MRSPRLRTQYSAVPALLLLGAHGSGAELAPLSSAELHHLCLGYVQFPESEEGAFCAAYVRGFIEGSSLVVLATEPTKQETFRERALRTRLGTSSFAGPKYCVNTSVTLNDFVLQMLVQAEDKPPQEGENASELLHRTLNRFHRCD